MILCGKQDLIDFALSKEWLWKTEKDPDKESGPKRCLVFLHSVTVCGAEVEENRGELCAGCCFLSPQSHRHCWARLKYGNCHLEGLNGNRAVPELPVSPW